MKRIILSAVLAGIFLNLAFSQQKVFSGEPEDSRQLISSRVISNEEQDFFILSLNTDKLIRRFYVDKNKSIPLLEQFFSFVQKDSGFMYYGRLNDEFIVDYRRMLFVGGTYRNKRLKEILKSPVTADFYIYETDLEKGTTVITDTIKATNNESLLHCYNRGEELNMITYVDGTDKLNIYHVDPEGARKTEVKIKVPGKDDVWDRSHKLSRKHFGVYDNNQRYHVIMTLAWDKAFVQKDKLVMLLSEKDGDVIAITVNLNDFNYTTRKFSPVQQPGPSNVAGNSAFLIDSLLITSYAYDNSIYVSLFSMETGQQLRSMEINEKNIEQFIADPIQRTGSFLSKSDMKDVAFKKFYSTVKNNDLALSGYFLDGKLFLSFGSEYKQVINGTTLLNIFLTAAGTYFINSSPNYYGYLISGYRGVQNSTYTSFDATFNLADFSPARVSPNFTIWERLLSFITLKRLNMNRCNFFYLNGYYYIGYMESDTRKYTVTRFSEKGVE